MTEAAISPGLWWFIGLGVFIGYIWLYIKAEEADEEQADRRIKYFWQASEILKTVSNTSPVVRLTSKGLEIYWGNDGVYVLLKKDGSYICEVDPFISPGDDKEHASAIAREVRNDKAQQA